MFCCTLLCVRSSIAIILMGKRELVTLLKPHSSIIIILMGKRELIALLNLSSWCLVVVERLFLAVPQGCLRFVIVVFPDHTHLLFFCHYHHLMSIWPLHFFKLTTSIKWICALKGKCLFSVKIHLKSEIYTDASDCNETGSLEACIWKNTELIYWYFTTFYLLFRDWASSTQEITVQRFILFQIYFGNT